ncbi:hypothetical protein [Allofournierella massiliensis]|uniref:hypothetical protein n=1 Tax=Allofournierella massiliensis TaxID=1650663 RepID=UPI0025A45D9F|nr:hypothetical protein [Fournierella massiliensis]
MNSKSVLMQIKQAKPIRLVSGAAGERFFLFYPKIAILFFVQEQNWLYDGQFQRIDR